MDFSKPIAEFLEGRKKQIQDNMVAEDANATGDTSESIDFTANELDGSLEADSSLENAQEGTPPASEGGGISVTAANIWISARGLFLDPQTVAAKINKSGTFLFQIGGMRDLYETALNEEKPIEELSNNILDTAISGIINEIDKIFGA